MAGPKKLVTTLSRIMALRFLLIPLTRSFSSDLTAQLVQQSFLLLEVGGVKA
jgi:hypothetical protein